MSWKTNLNLMSTQLAHVGEKMVKTGRGVVSAKNAASHARIAMQFPVKELATICGRAGVAGAMFDGASGAFHGWRALKRGEIDQRQAVIHAGAEAGCGFVTSSAGTAGTLAAYMITGTMGPIVIAAGMGASVGSRYIYRSIIGETLPPRGEQQQSADTEEGLGDDHDVQA